MSDSLFTLRYTGEEINSRLDKAGTALQPGALTPYKTHSQNTEVFVQKESGKGLSTQDFTTILKQKLDSLPTYEGLLQMLDAIATYRILTFNTSKEETRLQVPVSSRRYALIVSYNSNGDHVTEKYVSTVFTDDEWQKNENWQPLATFNKPKRPTTQGVYILDIDGYYTQWRDWLTSNNSKAVGVAIIDNKAQFMIALNDVPSQKWATVNTMINGVLAVHGDEQIYNDFFGESNTTKIIQQIGDRAPAANACRNYIFKNSIQGYLPSMGEWKVAYSYQKEVDQALAKAGGVAFPLYTDYWSSTQCPYSLAWYFRWCHAEHDCVNKSNTKRVRPFGKLPEE